MSINGVEVAERILHTSDTRLASVLMVFGAQLRQHLPLEWVDHHDGRERFCRYLEEKKKREEGRASSYEYEPKPNVTFYFDGSTVPAYELVEACHGDFAAIDAALENLLKDISEPAQSQL